MKDVRGNHAELVHNYMVNTVCRESVENLVNHP